ncbi:MAG: oligoendopeptidase F [bacterium]
MKSHHIFIKSITITTFLIFVLTISLLAGSNQIPQRADIDDKYKWNLDLIYPNLDAWEKDFRYVSDNYQKLENFKGRLSESGDVLYECLKLQEDINLITDNLSTYAGLRLSEDTRISAMQELSDRIDALDSKIRHATSYIEPELLSIPSEKLEELISENNNLKLYKFYFARLIQRQQHIFSPKEEAILALSGSMAYSSGRIFSMLTDADMTFGSIYDEDSNLVVLTNERYEKYRKSNDRRVRRDAHIAYYGTYEKYQNTLAATLGGTINKDFFYMKSRGFETCLDMRLAYNNIPTSLYYNLIETVNNNLEPLHKWAALKKKVLGYDTLYPYDLYVSLVSNQNKGYTYEEAMDMVVKGLAPMGEPYMTDFKKGLNSGWVDVFETEGKSSGAFSGGNYASPPYVLLNYNGTINWVFTLAHEMGHSMQSFYVNRNEPYLYHDYPIFTAEVASTCDEAILMKQLLKNTTDPQEKMYLLNLYIQNIRTTFFRQVMFAEFELAIHNHIEEGGAFSSEYFRNTFSDIYKKYWGEELTVDELSGMLGMIIPHFYSPYYVYQYATCFAAAQLMSQKIIDGEKGYLDTYMKFLSTGSSKYPVDVLKDAGIDMTQPEPILNTINLFSDLVDQLEKLLNDK